MRITTRSAFLTSVPLAAASLLLAACGPDRGESKSPNTEDNHATHATAPTEPVPTTSRTGPAIPTRASIQAYCEDFRGADTTLAGIDTTGEAADAFEDVLDNQRKVGTPADMPKETRQVFVDYLLNGDNFAAALRKLPEDSPVSEMRTNEEFFQEWGGKLETPEELRDYSAENCS